MADTTLQRFDVVIQGGGIVGLAMAVRLGEIEARSPADGRPGLTIAVIDADTAPEAIAADTLSLRTTSLNAGALALLERNGVLNYLPEQFLNTFDRLEAGDCHRPAALSFEASDIDLARFGVFVENDRLRYALWQQLCQQERVTLLPESRVRSREALADHQRLTLEDERIIEAALLIGADGARSTVRREAGIGTRSRDYAQNAQVINVRLAEHRDRHTTWQVFTPDGPLALLPLHAGQASLIWYDRPDTVRRRMSLDDEALRAAIRQHFPPRLPEIETILERGQFPITRQHAQRYVAPRLALIGDAAHVIHPMAGQGVNLGLADVEQLGEQLERALRYGRDPGDVRALRHYQRHQWPRNAAMLAAVDQLHDLFRSPAADLFGRGLGGANHLTPVKRLMMKLAVGPT
ncbi:2-octaprenyl-3-methyl-6-methoxy-1,4-benzoquinol hydroxylase [Kushneria sinocarnis]|uniref:2-octaprenyl-3-methyl-6-methoxy-1,4-benzoquinol hydroxylase n=1 Tax=Kushneria sinocarnis TaxID=595502 RepID=A0A420X0N9_9GAMM|nr:FAD-dependent monooxygenase [Kushneria sinocarnis]RKR07317.1 2-octaprenyl-3-methyl-6-methoxy-1,4-benzoquinol hydroxylase [Kushneria sinocarnis]